MLKSAARLELRAHVEDVSARAFSARTCRCYCAYTFCAHGFLSALGAGKILNWKELVHKQIFAYSVHFSSWCWDLLHGHVEGLPSRDGTSGVHLRRQLQPVRATVTGFRRGLRHLVLQSRLANLRWVNLNFKNLQGRCVSDRSLAQSHLLTLWYRQKMKKKMWRSSKKALARLLPCEREHKKCANFENLYSWKQMSLEENKTIVGTGSLHGNLQGWHVFGFLYVVLWFAGMFFDVIFCFHVFGVVSPAMIAVLYDIWLWTVSITRCQESMGARTSTCFFLMLWVPGSRNCM